MIYLASPYSHELESIREIRFHQVCMVAAELMRQGVHVYSPIAHSHPIAMHGLRSDWQFWKAYDHEYLRWCTGMIVLTLEGWKESVGVTEEIQFMAAERKPIILLDWQERLTEEQKQILTPD